MKVVIVGAGPTGLTAGVELARRGVEVVILERRTGMSTLSRAVGITPFSLNLLTASGVTEKLLNAGVKYQSVRFYHGRLPWTTIDLAKAKPVQFGHAYMLGLPQDDTERILRDVFQALGGTVHFGTEVTHVSQTASKVEVATQQGTTFQGDYLIAADGVKSVIRTAVGIDFPGRALPDVWSIADAEAEAWPHRDSPCLFMLPNGKMSALLPIGGHRVRLISNTDNALADFPLDIQVSEIHRQGQFQVTLNQVSQYSKGRVYLAGDAAHSQSPAGGRGMNLGIADACDLAHRMTGGGLELYSRTRHAEGKRVIQNSEDMRRLITSTSKTKRLLMLTALKTIARLPAVQRRVASRFLYG